MAWDAMKERFDSNEDFWECEKHPGEKEGSFSACPKCEDEADE